MRLIILGSGTAVPSLTRSPSGYLVRVGAERLLLDSGPGTLVRLLRAGVSIVDIDRVYYTHLHPDHVSDFVHLLFALNNPEVHRTRPLLVTGPRGFRAYYEKLLRVHGAWISPQRYDLEIRECLDETHEAGAWRITAVEVLHVRHSVAYRIEEAGRVAVYSGDTDMCEGIVAAARDADLLVIECPFPDEAKTTGHLTPRECGTIAVRSGARHMVLTHFYPVAEHYDLVAECRAVYDGPLTKAEDGMTFDLGPAA